MVATDTEENVVYVTSDLGCPGLWTTELELEDVRWISGEKPSAGDYLVRSRHTGPLREARVEMVDGGLVRVAFPESVRRVAPGQSVVVYDGLSVLGGGVVRKKALDMRARCMGTSS